MGRPVDSGGVQSLVPNTSPLNTLGDAFDYKSIASIAPKPPCLPLPCPYDAGSLTESELDFLTVGFTGQTIAKIFGEDNDTIVGYSSEFGPAPADFATEYNVVHVALVPAEKKLGATENQAVWNQVAAWLMGGSGKVPVGSSDSKPNPAPKAPRALGGDTSSPPPPVLDLTGYTEVSASNVSFSPASNSTLTINSATDITASSSTKTITEILLFQTVSDPTDVGLLYSTQSPFTIIFVPTRMGSTSFVAFALFSDTTYAVTTLDYTFQVSGKPLALNLVNAPAAALAVGSSAGVDAQALFSNGSVDVSQAASYNVRSGSASVISVNSTGLVTANGPGSDWLDVSYNGLTASTQIAVGSCTYAVGPGNQLANVSGGAASIQVTTRSGCAWTADGGGSPWLTLTNASGTGSGTVTLTATANTTGATRVAIVTVAGQRAAVTQPATSCSYTVNGTPISAPAAGLSGSLAVTTSCPIVVSSSATWLTVTPLSSSVNYFVAPNPSLSQRSGTITVGAQVVTVAEAGVSGSLATFAPASLSFGGQNVGATSGPRPVTLSNTGNAPLIITSIVPSGNFGATENCVGAIAPGGHCTVKVTFSPLVIGSLAGWLTITDNSSGVLGSTQSISLTGEGVVPPPTREWVWIGGSSALGSLFAEPGVYGTLGTPAPWNVPGGRTFASGWTDSSGNFWLFGGGGFGSANKGGLLNDLWEFNPSIREWTWMSGSSTVSQPGVYGTLGTPAAGNVPGGRQTANSWNDHSGNFWLFGGYGLDSTSTGGYLNDLWEFNPSTREWAWMGGNSTMSCSYQYGQSLCGQPGTYGTKGTPAAGNVPGGRWSGTSQTDASGNFLLFGGNGFDSTDTFGGLNDLWEFNPSTREWTWMSGSSTVDQPGVYGTLGVPSAGNGPGYRSYATSWIDGSGNFWFFGGFGGDSVGRVNASLNDLWEFNISTGEWTWMSGSSTWQGGQVGVYGRLGVPAATNVPGARNFASGWIDSSGNLRLFGGTGLDSTGTYGNLNELWEFNPSSREWTWMGGSSTLGCKGGGGTTCGRPGVYDTLGTPAAGNVPGGREGSVSWTDSSGDFWLFGGEGIDSAGTYGDLNDLWEYGSRPAATFSPASLSFGVQTVGVSSAAKVVELTNTGLEFLTLGGITITGGNSSDFGLSESCPGNLAGGASCTLSLTFTPTGAGPRKSSIRISDNAAGNPQQVPLTGVGTAVSLSASSLSFGSQAVGTSSSRQTVTITNKGRSTIRLSQIAITGADARDFSQTSTCGSTLAAGASCTVSITFTPTAVGTRTASLLFSDDGGGSPQVVSLSGTGTAATVVSIAVTPASASIPMGTTQQFTAVARTRCLGPRLVGRYANTFG
ncbi:MAG: choice-of-anchor D domain-containing protein [Terriglobia bacterium]